MENTNQNNQFSYFKERSKVRMNPFKAKMTAVCYILVSEGYHGLAQVIHTISNEMIICLAVKQQGCIF